VRPAALRREAPPLARIDTVDRETAAPDGAGPRLALTAEGEAKAKARLARERRQRAAIPEGRPWIALGAQHEAGRHRVGLHAGPLLAGLGEKPEDLTPFDPDAFVSGLLGISDKE
jgi:hypothetical protein